MDWWGYLSVLLMCAAKVVPGVAMGYAFGLKGWQLGLTLFAGGTLGVVVWTYLGDGIRRLWARLRGKADQDQQATRPEPKGWTRALWRRFGLVGAALLTPPILSPPFGTALALVMGVRPLRVVWVYTLSMALWAALFVWLGDWLVPALEGLWTSLGFG